MTFVPFFSFFASFFPFFSGGYFLSAGPPLGAGPWARAHFAHRLIRHSLFQPTRENCTARQLESVQDNPGLCNFSQRKDKRKIHFAAKQFIDTVSVRNTIMSLHIYDNNEGKGMKLGVAGYSKQLGEDQTSHQKG